MINIISVKSSIISHLKADSDLATYLESKSVSHIRESPEGSGTKQDLSPVLEIREAQWQGRHFTYPNIRVKMGTQTSVTNGTCYLDNSLITFQVIVTSELDSSYECDELMSYVLSALIGDDTGVKLSGSGFVTGYMLYDGVTPAIRDSNNFWTSLATFRTNLYKLN